MIHPFTKDPTSPFGSVHPRNKKLIGARLASAALAIQYNFSVNFLPPTYSTAYIEPTSLIGANNVRILFSNVVSVLVESQDHCKSELGVPDAECAWFGYYY